MGKHPIEVFWIIESTGKIVPCNDVDSLLDVLDGKRSINLHIKMYAESIYEGTLILSELEEWFPYFPDWVWKSIENQIDKLRSGARMVRG